VRRLGPVMHEIGTLFTAGEAAAVAAGGLLYVGTPGGGR